MNVVPALLIDYANATAEQTFVHGKSASNARSNVSWLGFRLNRLGCLAKSCLNLPDSDRFYRYQVFMQAIHHTVEPVTISIFDKPVPCEQNILEVILNQFACHHLRISI